MGNSMISVNYWQCFIFFRLTWHQKKSDLIYFIPVYKKSSYHFNKLFWLRFFGNQDLKYSFSYRLLKYVNKCHLLSFWIVIRIGDNTYSNGIDHMTDSNRWYFEWVLSLLLLFTLMLNCHQIISIIWTRKLHMCSVFMCLQFFFNMNFC